MLTKSVSTVVFLLLCALSVSPAAADEDLTPAGVLRGSKIFKKEVVVSGLKHPWEITWGPDGVLWVTERSAGRVLRVDPSTGNKRTAAEIEEVVAPGGQDGLLGLALAPGFLAGRGPDYVYVSYTYNDPFEGPDPNVPDAMAAYRFLYMKVARYAYDRLSGTLSDPVDVITGLPAGNDHNGGRLKIGPDGKLYLSIGDQGHNQFSNMCLPIESQRLPTAEELEAEDYSSYPGKILRINTDGSIPDDNPEIEGLVSHVYSYGHRNPQGLNFGPDGTLYSNEHGPQSDDEVNIIRPGGNYGWPHVAGFQDDIFYEYARWGDASTPCKDLLYTDVDIHPSVPRANESEFKKPFFPPLASMFVTPEGNDFKAAECGRSIVCWPTVGPSGVEYYEAGESGIPGWDKVLLVTTLKRGSLYVLPLDESGRETAGPFTRHFQAENRYRDSALSPDGRTVFLATDPGGSVEAVDGGNAPSVENPGSILAFTYQGESDEPIEPVKASSTASTEPSADEPMIEIRDAGAHDPVAPFTAEQAAAGKVVYEANCAVCHGTTLANGPYGPPLAGPNFDEKWRGKSAHSYFETTKTMPPSAPGSYEDSVYAELIAYILEVNGFQPGEKPLPTEEERLRGLAVR